VRHAPVSLLALALVGCSCPPLADEDAILRDILGEDAFAARFPAEPDPLGDADAAATSDPWSVPAWQPDGTREGLVSMDDGWQVPFTAAGDSNRGLVFVHGWASDRSFWREQLPALTDLGALLAVDLPGHGDSSAGGVPHSMDLYARAVLTAMDHVGLERAVLVGHSNGTPVIRTLQALAPERVTGLVIVDGAVRPMVDDPAQIDELIAPFRADGYADHMAGYVGNLFAPELDATLRDELQVRMQRTAQSTAVGAFEAAWTPEILEMPRMDLPVLCLMSEMWGPENENLVGRLAPQLTYVTYPTSHFVMLDAPVDVNARIRRWAQGLQLLAAPETD
jgi:pimeloyl-ACP methyl ester carboxylesterase